MTASTGTPTPDEERPVEPPKGSIVTDNGNGFPITRGQGNRWFRNGWSGGKTWAEVLEWHQEALDDPDDDTSEPYQPVVMVPARRPPTPGDNAGLIARAHRVAGALEEYAFEDAASEAAPTINDLADALEASQPRVVTTVAEAGNLTRKTVVRDANGDVFECCDAASVGKRAWAMAGHGEPLSSNWIKFPAIVLFTPTAKEN